MIPHDDRRRKLQQLAIILLPALVGMTLQLIATARFGAGLSPDSAVYVQAARQLAAGEGFTQLWPSPSGPPKVVPITWYPPAYPAFLAIGVKLGIDAKTFARFVAAILFGINIAIGMTFVRRVTRSIHVAIVAAAILCLSTDQLEVHAFALSEALFIAAVLLFLLFLVQYVGRPTLAMLVAAACCASLAGMTRYVGVILLPVGLIVCARRWRHAITFLLIGSAANVVWYIRNKAVAGSSTGREIAAHVLTLEHVRNFFETIATWTTPTSVWWLGATVLTLVVAVLVATKPRAQILVCFVFVYLTALALSISFIDAATPVDYRLLSPLFVPLVTLLALAATRGNSVVRITVGLLAASMLITDVIRTPSWVWRANQFGERLGYSSYRWEKSRAMKLMARLPANLTVWTNASDATYLHANRIDRLIPFKYTRDGTRELDSYRQAIATLRATVFRDGGAVVFFQSVLRRASPNINDLDHDLVGLRRIEYPGDAVVWAHPSAAKRFPAPATQSTMAGP